MMHQFVTLTPAQRNVSLDPAAQKYICTKNKVFQDFFLEWSDRLLAILGQDCSKTKVGPGPRFNPWVAAPPPPTHGLLPPPMVAVQPLLCTTHPHPLPSKGERRRRAIGIAESFPFIYRSLKQCCRFVGPFVWQHSSFLLAT